MGKEIKIYFNKRNGILTKKEQFDNSFYNADLTMRKALVIVPHQDDEINVAGHTILNLLHMGAEIYVVYTTNGDYELDPEVRMKEAQNAFKVLGIPKENMIILGYGDSSFHSSQHLFQAQKDIITSASGHSETYGVGRWKEYCYQKNGKHNPYLLSNYINDLKTVILDIKADFIFCVDKDEHPDHRILAIMFDRAMGEILSLQNNVYRPMVFKKFAYCLAYYAKPDFFSPNIISTQRPAEGMEKYHYDYMDTSFYRWDDRIRFPAAKGGESTTLKENKLGKALLKYISQYGASHADRIINGDDVYWQRRTDSLSYQAAVVVSSGASEYLNDYCLFNTDDIMKQEMVPCNYMWTPDKEDRDRKINFIWEKGQEISLIRIYGNINNDSRIEKLKISLNTGFNTEIGPFPKNGQPIDIELNQVEVTSCTIQILSAKGMNYGIAECEFFSKKEQKNGLPCFIKTLIHNDFIYTYWISTKIKELPLSFYKYGTSKKTKSVVVMGYSYIKDQVLYIDKRDNRIKIKTYLENDENVYDQVMIERCHDLQLRSLRVRQKFEVFLVYIYKKRSKLFRLYIYIKSKGLLYVIKKIKIRQLIQ